MKIYTRGGDEGKTALFAGGRVSKNHARLHAYGTVDELNSVLGVVLAGGTPEALTAPLQRVQGELFIVGADLATPLEAASNYVVRVSAQLTTTLETEIDEWDAQLPPLKHFILPGGTLCAALLHQARTICRRAERWVVALQDSEEINGETLRYLNRLSDWLFVAARYANHAANMPEVIWQMK
jgi:cob(I)alamin adenosyltransferase